MELKSFLRVAASFSVFFITNCNLHADFITENSYKLIQHQLASIPQASLNEQDASSVSEKSPLDKVQTLDARRQTVIDILATDAESSGNAKNAILTRHAVKELHILSGSATNPLHSVLKSLGPPHSVSGEIMLANLLLTPTDDVENIKCKQTALKKLLDNPKLITQLDAILSEFALEEHAIISLLGPINPFIKSEVPSPDAFFITKALAKSPTFYTVSQRVMQLGIVFIFAKYPAVFGAILGKNLLLAAQGLPFNVGMSVVRDVSNVFLVLAILDVLQYESRKKSYARQLEIFQFNIKYSLASTKSVLSALKIGRLLKEQPEFARILRNITDFSQIEQSPTLQKLLSLVKHTNQKVPKNFLQYLKINEGPYQVAINTLIPDRESLIPIIRAVGEVDAWVTVAKFVQSSQSRDYNPVVFANILPQESAPILHLTQFWNPLLKPETAIANDMKTGYPYASTNIITGPNAAGKSTNMDAIAISALMAQTLGVVPAQQADITPFSLIHSHRDISAEIAAGLSSFKAETVRALGLVHHINQLQNHQFSLSIMDEVFSSTNPVEGEAATYGYLKELAKNPNTINFCATHYSKPTLLARKYPDTFQNLHVSAELKDGALAYNYLLKPGYTTQRVAIKILEAEGIKGEFLDIANDEILRSDLYSNHDE